MDYDTVKSAVLRAYELVPEAYRQKFRKHMKSGSQTFVEFARVKSVFFVVYGEQSGHIRRIEREFTRGIYKLYF